MILLILRGKSVILCTKLSPDLFIPGRVVAESPHAPFAIPGVGPIVTKSVSIHPDEILTWASVDADKIPEALWAGVHPPGPDSTQPDTHQGPNEASEATGSAERHEQGKSL